LTELDECGRAAFCEKAFGGRGVMMIDKRCS
jgi:hypothetical protein